MVTPPARGERVYSTIKKDLGGQPRRIAELIGATHDGYHVVLEGGLHRVVSWHDTGGWLVTRDYPAHPSEIQTR
jgi:hypothetical protein